MNQENPNSTYVKPSVISRLCSGLVDLLLTVGTIFGLYAIVLKTPLGNNLNSYKKEMDAIQEKYVIEDNNAEQVQILTYVTKKSANEKEYTPYKEWTSEDQKNYKDLRFKYTLNQFVYMMSAAFIAELIFYFLIHLFNKRRATIGMFIAGEDLMAIKYYGKPKWYHLLGRLGVIFLLGTALPYYLLSDLTVFIIPAFTMTIALLNRKTNRTIHDLLTGTIIVMNPKTLEKIQERAEIRRIAKEEKQAQNN